MHNRAMLTMLIPLALSACNADETLGEIGSSQMRRDVEGFDAVVVTTGSAGGAGSTFATPGDIDGDGFDDLIVGYGHADSTSICQFLGGPELAPSLAESSADACITVAHASQEPVQPWPVRAIELGDLDEDGIADFGIWVGIHAEPTAELRVHLGTPARSATFDEPDAVLTIDIGSDDVVVSAMQPADIDGDGVRDLLLDTWASWDAPADARFTIRGVSGSSIVAALEDASSTLPTPTVIATAPEHAHYGAGDFGASDGTTLIGGFAWNDGSPLFDGLSLIAGAPDLLDPATPAAALTESMATTPSIHLGAPVDWDCDGRDELVGPVRDAGGRLAFFDADPAAPLEQRHVYDLDVSPAAQSVLPAGDVDGDGCEDLLVEVSRAVNRSALLLVHGGEQPRSSGEVPLSYSPISWTDRQAMRGIGDFNGDGFGDVIAAFAGGHEGQTLGDLTELQADDPIERLVLMYGGPRQ